MVLQYARRISSLTCARAAPTAPTATAPRMRPGAYLYDGSGDALTVQHVCNIQLV